MAKRSSTIPRPEAVSLRIDGSVFSYWSDLEITLSVDSFSTATFRAPFDPSRKEFRETFRPFSFKPLKIVLDGDPLFTGTLVDVYPKAEAKSSSVDVNGYALPGVLDDCTSPGDSVPHEFLKLGLRSIAEALAKPFDLRVEFKAPEGAKFKKVKLDEEQKIFAFLTELAKQRNVVFSNTPEGALLCWQSVDVGNPVAHLVEGGETPITEITPSFSPQEYFSEITGFPSTHRGRRGTKVTERNPWLTRPIRPMSFKLSDTENADAPEATRAKLGRMFANMASWDVEVPTWRDPDGELWEPNTTIMLTAPRAMIYRRTELLIRSVKLRQSASSGGDESASLNLVLPGAFNGKPPTFLPWDEPI